MNTFEHVTEYELLLAAYHYYIELMDKHIDFYRTAKQLAEKKIYEKKAKDCKIKADEIRARIIQIEQNQ